MAAPKARVTLKNIYLTASKVTKGALQYKELDGEGGVVVEDFNKWVCGSIYLRKDAIEAAGGDVTDAENIRVTIEIL